MVTKIERKKVLLSAITPTNKPTLGNLLGALNQWVRLQDQYDCLFFAVDMHAITDRMDSQTLKDNTYLALALYLAAGINPNNAVLFVQSHVSQHAELAWVLNCFTYMGELQRMTQFKDKAAKHDNIPAGLFNYPVLMAADILLYDANLVPVGADQKQHIELTRNLAQRINGQFGKEIFVVPEVFTPPIGGRVMSLQNPEAKMSKSDADQNASIYLTDSDDQIVKKLKRAVTDSGNTIRYSDEQPGVKNLIGIISAISGKTPEAIVDEFAGKMYGHLKLTAAEVIVGTVGPIRDKAFALLKDKGYLDEVLAKGAEIARAKANQKISDVYQHLGFIKAK